MIAIVDYGVGNINAFLHIYKRLGIPAEAARDCATLERATHLILPGVGAFDHAMEKLDNSGMRASLEHLVQTRRRPVLGVCVGMQMLAESSEEGVRRGLNWIGGIVRKFDAQKIPYKTKYPHMGWNDLRPVRSSRLLETLETGARFYFLHSYYFACTSEADVLATATYGEKFATIINRGNIYGVQCHPEKSHGYGIALLQNFARL